MSDAEESETVTVQLRVGDREFLEEVVDRTDYDTVSEMATALVTEAFHNFSRGDMEGTSTIEVELDAGVRSLYEHMREQKGDNADLELITEFLVMRSIGQGVSRE